MTWAFSRSAFLVTTVLVAVSIGVSSARADSGVARELVGFKGKESEMLKKVKALGYENVAYGNSVYISSDGKTPLGWITAFQLVHGTDYQLLAYGHHALMVDDPQVEVYRAVPATCGARKANCSSTRARLA